VDNNDNVQGTQDKKACESDNEVYESDNEVYESDNVGDDNGV